MMSDGLTAAQSEGKGEDVEVVDVAQMLLAAVKRRDDGQPTEAEVPGPQPTEPQPTEPQPVA